MKAAFYTLGCKVNQYETEYMAEILKNAGMQIVSHSEDADYYIINSCTVTATADQKTRQNVRKFKRQHPNSVVILTGCMPQAFPEQASALNEADIVLSNKSNDDILDLINRYNVSHNRIVKIDKHQKGDEFTKCSIEHFSERIRAFVKIEDGCDRFCSYCIIPMSRGRVRSKSLDDLKNEIKMLGNNGIKEIVLVGINLSSYGKGEDFNIVDAVRICNDDENIRRVRLGSLEPDHITDKVIEGLAKYEKFCPQFHISLQSGCDKTLKDMNRHYSSDEYRQLCKKLRSTFDDATITTDIMVGFNDETEEDFNTSLQFAKEIGFEKVHTFPYSERQGTVASRKGDNVPKQEKERRASVMIEETNKIRHEYFNKLIGAKEVVLFENNLGGNTYQGYTKNYVPVRMESDTDIIGKEIEVTIKSADINLDCCFA
ncbi:MAG: tRNA (N(6)-L-threonylcarbamoyladenosine(37)-C(2))-methylthiotransferase MtaB [Eubacterium coprostanoligenes]|uniref:tRNA (N(6)-L-threonylcarbamoyladenosine(37)-C(2))- methylthiotransferase MtaB n=1 Tax=Eubacterium coprostanoligenes TaxID=290054 RepID=UPI0024096BBF|nr:tRNA (N(6)-L-threonylcarbamoyladenosine(37)-C(2))-methylthiotransferase MtaB [Eubacterium coprostanoligenes]MDD6665273.1 tRNA (N(6)-L-threonylcarbamoyladenosine(37)-C(2))-methylthiotransferase MtaB [Eubacterium coprostanoligenes]